jgi:hypothetical protein
VNAVGHAGDELLSGRFTGEGMRSGGNSGAEVINFVDYASRGASRNTDSNSEISFGAHTCTE